MANPTIAWMSSAAYLYVLHLDESQLAWEYLRRNPIYRQDWLHSRADPLIFPVHAWGFAENPDLDGRQAQPCWWDDTGSVRIDPTERASNTLTFSLWRIPGRKRLLHRGQRLALTTDREGDPLRLSVAPGMDDESPFAVSMPARADLSAYCLTARRLTAALTPHIPLTSRRVARRPTRLALTHMRALQALDGALASASHRDIGEAIFGSEAMRSRWHADSELRAQLRHLIRRGRTLMSGGYRTLFGGSNAGRFPKP